jgi:hypothetical protein
MPVPTSHAPFFASEVEEAERIMAHKFGNYDYLTEEIKAAKRMKKLRKSTNHNTPSTGALQRRSKVLACIALVVSVVLALSRSHS